jgi:hypothetical protein
VPPSFAQLQAAEPLCDEGVRDRAMKVSVWMTLPNRVLDVMRAKAAPRNCFARNTCRKSGNRNILECAAECADRRSAA